MSLSLSLSGQRWRAGLAGRPPSRHHGSTHRTLPRSSPMLDPARWTQVSPQFDDLLAQPPADREAQLAALQSSDSALGESAPETREASAPLPA